MRKVINILFVLLINVIVITLDTTNTYSQALDGFSDRNYAGQMTVGTDSAHYIMTSPSAWLQIGDSLTNKGLLLPRVLDTLTISSPPDGLLIYRILNNNLYIRSGSSWQQIISITALEDTLNGKMIIDTSTGYSNLYSIIGQGGSIVDSGANTVLHNNVYVYSPDSLSEMHDVTLTSPALNQLLQYNGSKWINWTSNYLTGNQTITLSGDITGSGTTAITTTLKNTGTAGNYTRVTTDAQGRVSSATDTAYLPLSGGTVTGVITATAYTNTDSTGYLSTDIGGNIIVKHLYTHVSKTLSGVGDSVYIDMPAINVRFTYKDFSTSGADTMYVKAITGTSTIAAPGFNATNPTTLGSSQIVANQVPSSSGAGNSYNPFTNGTHAYSLNILKWGSTETVYLYCQQLW